MGKISKGVPCSVSACGAPAVRSVGTEKIVRAGFAIETAARGYLCRRHYKELKKKLKPESRLERLRHAG